jgi:beta-lactamase class A
MSSDLAAALDAEAHIFPGRVGYAVMNLISGERLLRRADEIFPTASAVKLPVLTAFHAFVAGGGARWDDTVEITERCIPGGSGVLQHLSFPRRISYQDAAWLMICVSDNLATNVLLRAMSIEVTNKLIGEIIGPDITVKKYAGFDPAAPVRSMGQATPRALTQYLERLAAGALPGAAATLAVAEQQSGRHSIPRYLPHDKDVPTALRIANKPGSLPGIRTDIAVVREGPGAVAMSFMTADASDRGSTFENEGEKCIGRLARTVYDAWLGEAA